MRYSFDNETNDSLRKLLSFLNESSTEACSAESARRTGISGLIDRLFPKRAERRQQRARVLKQQIKSDRQKLYALIEKAMKDKAFMLLLLSDPEWAAAQANLKLGDYGMQVLKCALQDRSAIGRRDDHEPGAFVDFW